MRNQRITTPEKCSPKIVSMILLYVYFAGVCLALHACTLLTVPVATVVLGGSQIALRGAELQKEIRKADAQEAVAASFKETWDKSLVALTNLDIEIDRSERTLAETGGVIEGMANETRVTVVARQAHGEDNGDWYLGEPE